MRIFRPCKGGLARLGGLAARGGSACVSGWPCWGEGRHDDVFIAILQQRGVPEARCRPGFAEGGLFLPQGRIKDDHPPRWRSRHEGMEVTATTAPDSTVVLHYPIGCSNCGQTHVLSERPSFSRGASLRFRCQRCHIQVRSSMCTCRACGSKLVHCRCSVEGAHSTLTQRPLAAFFAAAATRANPHPCGLPPASRGRLRLPLPWCTPSRVVSVVPTASPARPSLLGCAAPLRMTRRPRLRVPHPEWRGVRRHHGLVGP